jgi:hypothetical protein
MLASRATVSQDFRVAAPGGFESVGESRHATEVAVLVNGGRKRNDFGGSPTGVALRRGLEGIAEDVT